MFKNMGIQRERFMTQYDKVLIIAEVEKTDLDKTEVIQEIMNWLKKSKKIVNITKMDYASTGEKIKYELELLE